MGNHITAICEDAVEYPSFGIWRCVCDVLLLQVRFVVMANIFVTDLQIHRRYDIKGSTEGRTVGAEARSK